MNLPSQLTATGELTLTTEVGGFEVLDEGVPQQVGGGTARVASHDVASLEPRTQPTETTVTVERVRQEIPTGETVDKHGSVHNMG